MQINNNSNKKAVSIKSEIGKALPRLSVITVVLNSEKQIEQTIHSVASQIYPNFEYIVIDGNSTDGTRDIIKYHQDKIAFWKSEPDNGIYDAMNKGWMAATGDYVLFLNAGDTFADKDVLIDVAQELDEGLDMLVGDYFIAIDENRRVYGSNRFDRGWRVSSGSLPSCHQAIFFNRALLGEVGGFSTKYKIASDYEWMLKLYKMRGKSGRNVSVKPYNRPVSIFRADGLSEQKRLKTVLEIATILRNEVGTSQAIRYGALRLSRLLLISLARFIGIADHARYIYRKNFC